MIDQGNNSQSVHMFVVPTGNFINPFTPRVSYGDLSFELVGEIPWCGHSNEISFTVLSHGPICLTGFIQYLKIIRALRLVNTYLLYQ